MTNGKGRRPALVRLDRLLVKQGLAASRDRARQLIEQHKVRVDGLAVTKAASRVRSDQNVQLIGDDFSWVGRGALKLLPALQAFQVEPDGHICADLGASTGGFTEVLLHHGAKRVYSVDVGSGQLAWKLRTDPRVVVMENTNARHLDALPEPIDLLVGDLSFIGLALILPTVKRLLDPAGEAVLLVKPQFEAGPGQLARGGRVRSEEDRLAAIDRVRTLAEDLGFQVIGGIDCELPGAKAGNIEHFLHLNRGFSPPVGSDAP